MFSCKLCERETVFTTSICEGCRKIRHYMNIYTPKRVYEILDNVLSREEDKQDNKIKEEIKDEIENKKYNLRKGKRTKSVGDESYTQKK